MLDNKMLLDAIGGVRPEYILDAQQVLGYCSVSPRKRHKKLWRTILLAAVIAALLGATAYATGFFGLKDRTVEMPADSTGAARQAVIPNGFIGSPTYMGSAEWWTYGLEREDANGENVQIPDYSFAQGNDTMRKTAELYNVLDQAMMDKLLEIAQNYNLQLYSEYISFLSLDELYKLSGISPFMDGLESTHHAGYVFADGSFKDEFTVESNGLYFSCSLHKIHSGSVYPYGGSMYGASSYEEYLYTTRQGYDVGIGQSESMLNGKLVKSANISYANEAQDCFIELCYDIPSAKELESLGLSEKQFNEAFADKIEFSALCQQNEAAQSIISVSRGAEDNRDAMERLIEFQNSPVFQAGKEFQSFFTATFYDLFFNGTYGMEGYADIDQKLDTLSAKYGLTYATGKHQGNEFYDNATVYDNGAWYATLQENSYSTEYRIEYIPKTALYTGLLSFLDYEQYQRAWIYETSRGESLVIFTDGPEKEQRPGILYENDTAYVLLTHGAADPTRIENLAETVNWSQLH
jgi:hypothetical protein